MAFETIIRGGEVVDGTGRSAYRADVGIDKDRVAAVGMLGETEAARVIDATGKTVCPGFINIHTHDDLYIIRDDYREVFEPYVRQGITTSVVSNCGWSPAPWLSAHGDLLLSTLTTMGVSKDLRKEWETQADFHAYLEARPLPVNMVPLAAHGPIRIAVMGEKSRFSTPEELERMKGLVREGMEAGCRGFSTGLTYFPGVYAHTDEIVELAGVAAERGGRYVTHVRGHSATYDRAVAEAVEIAERSGSSLQLSHVFAVPDLGRMANLLYYAVGVIEAINRVIPLPGVPNAVLVKAMGEVDRALERGLDVGMDFIPYVLGNTTVTQLYPPWANLGGTEKLLERLSDPETRARIRRDVESLEPIWPHWEEGSWSDNYIKALGWKMLEILSVGSERNRHMEGRRVEDLAREAGKDNFEFLADLAVEENGMVTFLFGLEPRPWTEKVFTRVQDHPQLSVGGDTLWPETGDPPPSAYGCFPRILEHYVRDLGMYTLEEAVFRCTGLSASRFGLEDRGVIEEGAAADLVVFDPREVADLSTMANPRVYPGGIEYVLLNGEVMVEAGRYRGDAMPGRLLTA